MYIAALFTSSKILKAKVVFDYNLTQNLPDIRIHDFKYAPLSQQ